MVASSAPALTPLRPRGLKLTHVSIVPVGGGTGQYTVNRHFEALHERYPQQESWEDRSLAESLELVAQIMRAEGRW